MKLCIYADPHWSTYSSILRQRGKQYSKRLEALIESINWVESVAQTNDCDSVICLGDFFDRNTLSAEELTALKEIKWSSLPHTFLVGNHEITTDDLSMNSLNALEKVGTVIDKTTMVEMGDCQLIYIPYIDEDYRKPLRDEIGSVIKDTTYFAKRVIFSHNDIKGIRYGAYVSETGYTIDEINACATLYFNGHLHNGEMINDKIINVGNLSGQNFTENAFKHKHGIYILDTNTLQMEFMQNPYAIDFYKFEINKESDLSYFDLLSERSVISLKVKEDLLPIVKEKINSMGNIIAHREILVANDDGVVKEVNTTALQKVNYLDEFREFCLDQIGNFEILKQELDIVCK